MEAEEGERVGPCQEGERKVSFFCAQRRTPLLKINKQTKRGKRNKKTMNVHTFRPTPCECMCAFNILSAGKDAIVRGVKGGAPWV